MREFAKELVTNIVTEIVEMLNMEVTKTTIIDKYDEIEKHVQVIGKDSFTMNKMLEEFEITDEDIIKSANQILNSELTNYLNETTCKRKPHLTVDDLFEIEWEL